MKCEPFHEPVQSTLTDEERAERAWEAHETGVHHELEDWPTGDQYTAEEMRDMFKAGYLAALKEK